MNVSKSTQFELALLLRTLKILKACPGVSMVAFFEDMLPVILAAPDRSLSAYWKEKYGEKEKDLVCLVTSGSSEETGVVSETKIMDLRELDYLKEGEHADMKHDPLSIVKTIFNTALYCFQGPLQPEQVSTLVTASSAIGFKSARASLILHAVLLCTLLKDEMVTLPKNFLQEIYKVALNTASKDVVGGLLPYINEYEKRRHEESRSQRATCSTYVLSFGKADHGKLGHGDLQLNRQVPTIIDALRSEPIVKVASMSTYALALTSKGQVFIWGTGGTVGAVTNGRLSISPQPLETIPSTVVVKDISCGLGHTLFLSTTGQVWAWGNGGNGRCGLGDVFDRTEACLLSSLAFEKIVALQCGASHSLALTDKGQVYSWGKNSQGQCGHGNLEDVLKPALVKKFQNDLTIVQLAAGWEHSMALTKQGKLYSWGCGYKDSRRGIIPPVLGLGHNECRPSPELVNSIESIVITGVTSGWDHCLAVDKAGKLLSWGSGQNGCEHSAAITVDGDVYTWGHGDGGRLGMGNNAQSFVPVKVDALSSMKLKSRFVHCGDKFTAVICEPMSGGSMKEQSSFHSTELFVERSQYDNLIKDVTRKEGHDGNPAAGGRSKDALAARQEFFSSLRDEEHSEVSMRCSDVAASLLHCMVAAGVYRLPLTTFNLACFERQFTNSLMRDTLAASSLSLSDDYEICVEVSEDTYINMNLLLEAAISKYCKNLHAIAFNGQVDPNIMEELGSSGKSNDPQKQVAELSESFVVASYELKGQFEVLHNLLLVCCINMISLDTVVKNICEGKKEEEISQALKSKFLQFALRREEAVKEDYSKTKSKQLNDALSFHSQESDDGSLSLQDDLDSGVYEKATVRQRNHSHRSHFTKQHSLRDDEEDILSKGESTDFDNDGSLDDSLSQEGSLHDQHENPQNADLMSTLNTGYSTSTGAAAFLDDTTGKDGLTRQKLQQGSAGKYKVGGDDNCVEDHHSLSPAPSYESLENSLDERKGNIEGFMEDQSNRRDPFDLTEDIQGKEDSESIEFQQALLSSIANSQKEFVPRKYLKKIESKRGQA
eukprot:gene31544-38125_t